MQLQCLQKFRNEECRSRLENSRERKKVRRINASAAYECKKIYKALHNAEESREEAKNINEIYEENVVKVINENNSNICKRTTHHVKIK